MFLLDDIVAQAGKMILMRVQHKHTRQVSQRCECCILEKIEKCNDDWPEAPLKSVLLYCESHFEQMVCHSLMDVICDVSFCAVIGWEYAFRLGGWCFKALRAGIKIA